MNANKEILLLCYILFSDLVCLIISFILSYILLFKGKLEKSENLYLFINKLFL